MAWSPAPSTFTGGPNTSPPSAAAPNPIAARNTILFTFAPLGCVPVAGARVRASSFDPAEGFPRLASVDRVRRAAAHD